MSKSGGHCRIRRVHFRKEASIAAVWMYPTWSQYSQNILCVKFITLKIMFYINNINVTYEISRLESCYFCSAFIWYLTTGLITVKVVFSHISIFKGNSLWLYIYSVLHVLWQYTDARTFIRKHLPTVIFNAQYGLCFLKIWWKVMVRIIRKLGETWVHPD
jgi:hypothetical protein